ncbi:unnamed protein product [Calypogeia fissa]
MGDGKVGTLEPGLLGPNLQARIKEAFPRLLPGFRASKGSQRRRSRSSRCLPRALETGSGRVCKGKGRRGGARGKGEGTGEGRGGKGKKRSRRGGVCAIALRYRLSVYVSYALFSCLSACVLKVPRQNVTRESRWFCSVARLSGGLAGGYSFAAYRFFTTTRLGNESCAGGGGGGGRGGAASSASVALAVVVIAVPDRARVERFFLPALGATNEERGKHTNEHR